MRSLAGGNASGRLLVCAFLITLVSRKPRTFNFCIFPSNLDHLPTRFSQSVLQPVSMYTLLQNPPQDQESWRFNVPNNHLALPRRRNEKNIYGKFIKFAADAITLEMSQFPSNRILRSDDPAKFLLVSFEKLRFPEGGLRVTADYITRMMKARCISEWCSVSVLPPQ